MRTLTVFSNDGLANRLRVLVSGMAVAEATGRAFTMRWPRNPHCRAAFRELFTNGWPVQDDDAPDPALAPYAVHPWTEAHSRRLVDDPRPHVVVGSYTWLVRPDEDEASGIGRRSLELLSDLAPLPVLASRIAAFASTRFRRPMIGVHLRRGDYTRMRPHLAGNTTAAMTAVDRLLEVSPEAGILLCSDDGAMDVVNARGTRAEGVHERFAARYGTRVVWTVPRASEARSVSAIEDAVVDLFLLRQTDAVVGTTDSSFSELAAAGRAVPHMFVRGAVSGYGPFAPLAYVPKLHGLALRTFRLANRFRR